MYDVCRTRWSLVLRLFIALPVALPGITGSLSAAEPALRLVGIATVGNGPLALLENESAPPRQRELQLLPGQREEGIRVLEINSAAGNVKLEVEGKTQEIGFAPAAPASIVLRSPGHLKVSGHLNQQAEIRLQGAGLRQVFALYQQLAERSLLRSSALPALRLDLRSVERVTVADILQGIEQTLRDNGIALKPDGEKFVIASEAGAPDRITLQVRETAVKLAAAPEPNINAAQDSDLPAGTINFPGTDLNQVLQIFQELANRTLVRSVTLPATTIDFRTYTPLTKAEAIYAFVAFLAENGVSVFPAGDHFMLVCSSADARQAVGLLERRPAPVPLPAEERLPTGTLSGSPVMNLKQVVATYQELAGKTVEIDPDTNLTRPLFVPRAQTPLTRAETIYLFDLLLAWNGWEVLPQTDGRLKLTRIKTRDRP